MSPLSQQDEKQEGDSSSTEDRRQRKHDRRSASSSSAPGDRSSQVIVDVAQTRRNESRCSNRAGTLDQLREVIERRVDRAYPMRNRTGRSGVTWSYFLLFQMSLAAALHENRLESVQEARRRAGEQAVVAIHPRSDKRGESRLRGPRGNDLMQLLMRRS